MPEERTRRLAAVWFADIVGYTALSAQDEDAALTVVDELQSIANAAVEERGGRVVKYLGDAVLTVFDSVDSALKAAFDLQVGFEGSEVAQRYEVALRIGLHLGEVVEAEDGDVYGDGVNTASRIEGVARPGEVAVTEAVFQQIHNRPQFDTEPLGRKELKGLKSTAVYTVRLVDASHVTGHRHPKTRHTRPVAVGVAAAVVGFASLTVLIAQSQRVVEPTEAAQAGEQLAQAGDGRDEESAAPGPDPHPTDAADLPPPSPRYGMWSVNTQSDPMDDSQTTTLMLPAIQGAASLQVECRTQRSVRIVWPSPLGSEEVEVRMGTGRARTVRNQWMREGDGRTLAYRGNPRRLLRDLAGSGEFAVRVHSEEGGRLSAVFQLNGLRLALDEARATCGA
jgi:class 3 adenylate cyclase